MSPGRPRRGRPPRPEVRRHGSQTGPAAPGRTVMADELKSMLQSLEKSKGKKRFYFAYGTGKRKDGKAFDGSLAVGGTRIKKEEVEQECACQQFFEGRCWSSPDGEVVYFAAKGSALKP